MTSKLSCSPPQRPPAINRPVLRILARASLGAMIALLGVPVAAAADAPQWMHAQVNAPLPAYDEKTDAVLLYSETNVTVVSADKIRTQVREAYKILRPSGRWHGTVLVSFNPQRK